MKYETEFRMKELEYREKRDELSHEKVIDELANIVRHADTSIEVLEGDIDNYIGENLKLKLDLKNNKTDFNFELRGTYGVLVVSLAFNILGGFLIWSILA